MSAVAKRLADANITLPEVATPAAAYVPFTQSGNIVYISGQLPAQNGTMAVSGHLGKNVTVEAAQEGAKICALHILAILKHACGGNLDAVKKCLKLEILVAATPDFTEPHVVANGASNTIITALGEQIGSHARVAYGVATLPRGAAVEVAATFEVA